jgi:hypothetical protein
LRGFLTFIQIAHGHTVIKAVCRLSILKKLQFLAWKRTPKDWPQLFNLFVENTLTKCLKNEVIICEVNPALWSRELSFSTSKKNQNKSPRNRRPLYYYSNLNFVVVTFLTKIQNWCYKTNKKTCQNTIVKQICMVKTSSVLSKNFGW